VLCPEIHFTDLSGMGAGEKVGDMILLFAVIRKINSPVKIKIFIIGESEKCSTISWEEREEKKYYYHKTRIGTHVQCSYVG
jgi:hypothetical protein